ncbi:MAG TPA: DUF481 domain-containing protein [Sphingobium sp.]|uniref:DUF481 domain-containing protein n=1 Tax=Sphingobium sp. TaxID=1912891 RepID=UPI002ED1D5AD
MIMTLTPARTGRGRPKLSRSARLLLTACSAPWLTVMPANAEIPPAVEAMIREAARTQDDATIDAVVKVAKATNPAEADEIGTLAKSLKNEAQDKARRDREERLATLHYWQGWTGEGQAGFGLTTGNTDEVSGVIGLSLRKESLKTRHKVEALADFLRTNGFTTREKFGTSYSLDYLLREGFYIYGIAGWEQDRFAGYARRFTESLGIGLRVLNRPDMTLDLDAGPAFRQTLFTDGTSASEIGPRASLAYKWTLPRGMMFSENASVVTGDGGSTFIADTAFTSKITNSLSGRMSVKVQTESNHPIDAKPTDTTSRATLVYKF